MNRCTLIRHICCALFLAASGQALASDQIVPRVMPFQAQVVCPPDSPCASIDVTYRGGSGDTAGITGTPRFTDGAVSLAVDASGFFNYLVGSSTPLTADDFDADSMVLEMEVNGEEIHPAVKIGTVPYSFITERLRGDILTQPQYLRIPTPTNPSGVSRLILGGPSDTIGGRIVMELNVSAPNEDPSLAMFRNTISGTSLVAQIAADGAFFTKGNIGTANSNVGNYTFVAGNGNSAFGNTSTVGGGQSNLANGIGSAIGGGFDNTASGTYATVPGGYRNTAQSLYSFAAGCQAIAGANGTVVIAANQNSLSDSIQSTTAEQMVLRADGLFFLTNTGGTAPFVATRFLNTSTGAYLSTGGTWTNLSDANAKENFRPVDGEALLEKLAQLKVGEWNYKAEPDVIKHIGPTAQDFHALFGVGDGDKSISTIDPSGIALAAIQQLDRRTRELAEKTERLEQLESEVAQLRELVQQLQDQKR